jgi:tetratricopeptide (TPR) repeat protein
VTAVHFVNYYEILQVPQTASDADVRAAVTKQRRVWVKRQGSPDPARRTEAEQRMRHIDQAEKILLSQVSRTSFDRELASYRPPAAASAVDDVDWLDKARAYLNADNPGAANYAAREAVNQRSSSHEAWFVRGHSSFLLGNGPDAEYELAEASRLQPDSSLYHYALGEVYSAQEKWQAAMAEYQRALRMEPRNPEYLTSVAQVHLQTDSAGKAVEIMEQVVREHPANPAFKFYLAIALHDHAIDQLAEFAPMVYNGQVISEGGFMIASEAQADLFHRTAMRIEGFRLPDSDVQRMVTTMYEQAADAIRIRWNINRSLFGWLTVCFLFGFLPLISGIGGGSFGSFIFGLLVSGAVVTIVMQVYRRPVWKHRRSALRMVRRGI